MAPQKHEQVSTTTSRVSLTDYLDGGRTTGHAGENRRPRRRACPVVALLGLLTHLLTSGSGATISMLVVQFRMQNVSRDGPETFARILLLVASFMGVLYVFTHVCAARAQYIRSYAAPQIYGYFSVAVAVLILRLGVPVWTAAVVLTAMVAAEYGFNAAAGIQGNVVWVQLGIILLGLTSSILMIVVTETTERPFATLIFSKRAFIRDTNESDDTANTVDLSVSRAGFRLNEDQENTSSIDIKFNVFLGGKTTGFDRSTINTPESPDAGGGDNERPEMPTNQRNAARTRVRSQPFPTPLQSIFSVKAIPVDAQESPWKNGAHMAWRPSAYLVHSSPNLAPIQPGLTFNSRQSRASQLIATSSRLSSGNQLEAEFPPFVAESQFMDPESQTPSTGTTDAESELTKRPTLKIVNPDPESEPQESPAPSLARLLGHLSTRAVVRQRNSLLGQRPNLPGASRAPNEVPRSDSRATDMAAVLFNQPTPFVQIAHPSVAIRSDSLLVQKPDLTSRQSISLSPLSNVATYHLDDLDENMMIPGPKTPPRVKTTMKRENSTSPAFTAADSRLVRNFSRPRTSPCPRTVGGGEEVSRPRLASVDRGRDLIMRADSVLARRSKSSPPAQEHVAFASQGSIDASQSIRQRNARTSAKSNATANLPRFSPFPKTPGNVELAVLKGLGQGSTKCLDERIAQWRKAVQTDTDTQEPMQRCLPRELTGKEINNLGHQDSSVSSTVRGTTRSADFFMEHDRPSVHLYFKAK